MQQQRDGRIAPSKYRLRAPLCRKPCLDLVDFFDRFSCILNPFGQLEEAAVYLHQEMLFTGPDGVQGDGVERGSGKLGSALLISRVERYGVEVLPVLFLMSLNIRHIFKLVADFQGQIIAFASP